MTNNQFNNLVIEEINSRLGKDAKVSVNSIVKNNGIKLSGLTIRESEINITPTIYLENFYDRYINSEPFENIIDDILHIHYSNKMESDFDISFFEDYSKVKERIVFRLINRDSNKELLESVPHKEYLDLAIVFCYYFEETDFHSSGSIMIRNEHLKLWQRSVDDLYEDALENTPRVCGFELRNIAQVIEESGADVSMILNDSTMPPLYVISNEKMYYGASSILYKDALKAFSLKLSMNLFIIPSSIHEMILFPVFDDDLDSQVSSIINTIGYVNSNELSKEDILSNNLYYYSYENDSISIL